MEDEIVLYSSSTCGMCKMVKDALKKAKISFNVNQDENYMLSHGISNIPILEVNGKRMNAQEAIKWINGRNKEI